MSAHMPAVLYCPCRNQCLVVLLRVMLCRRGLRLLRVDRRQTTKVPSQAGGARKHKQDRCLHVWRQRPRARARTLADAQANLGAHAARPTAARSASSRTSPSSSPMTSRYIMGWRGNKEAHAPALGALVADGVVLDRHYMYQYCRTPPPTGPFSRAGCRSTSTWGTWGRWR